MEKFKTVLNIFKKQASLGAGVVTLLTTGLEEFFSLVVFKCPCSSPTLNLVYSLVLLLVPALVLLLLGFIFNKEMWKLLTGGCRNEGSCSCRKLLCAVLKQIDCWALLAFITWIVVALLNGEYYECAMTGVSSHKKYLCGEKNSSEQCQKDLFMFPCGKGLSDQKDVRDNVLQTLRAQSQIIGWVLIISITLIYLICICCSRCRSPISYLHLKYRWAYNREENHQMDDYTKKHTRELADRNLKIFFKETPPQEIQTSSEETPPPEIQTSSKKTPPPEIQIPSKENWENISSEFKFSPKEQCYSALHQFVKNQTKPAGSRRTGSVESADLVVENPPAADSADDETENVPLRHF